MEQVVWSVEERFTFPTIGLATEAKNIHVTPQWQLEYDVASIRLVGVYHITANLEFEAADVQEPNDDVVVIDDVDFDGTAGYFEYALPFTVDLPDNAGAPRLNVQDVRTVFQDDSCVITWDVSCHYAVLQPLAALEPDNQNETHAIENNWEVVDMTENIEVFNEIAESTALKEESLEIADNIQAHEQHTTASVEARESLAESVQTMTSAPLIWDLKDTYTVKQYALNQIVRK